MFWTFGKSTIHWLLISQLILFWKVTLHWTVWIDNFLYSIICAMAFESWSIACSKLNFWNIACYILIYHLEIQKVLTLNTMCFSVNLIHTQTQTFENLYSSCQRCVATALMYSCCYSYCYQCLVKSTANLDVINFNKIGMHEAFITPKRIPIMKVMQSLCP